MLRLVGASESPVDWVQQLSPTVSPWLGVLFLILGATAAACPPIWRYTRLGATWVHEVSHAIAAICTGRKVTGMRVHADTSGVTEHYGRERGIGRIITTFAGYPGPALLGLAICVAIGTHHIYYVLAGMFVFGVLLLPIQRSWRGALITLGVAALIAATFVLNGNPVVVCSLLLVVAGYMFIASPRTIIELHRARAQRKNGGAYLDDSGVDHSDADSLAQMTLIPALVWEGVFLLVSAAAITTSIMVLFS